MRKNGQGQVLMMPNSNGSMPMFGCLIFILCQQADAMRSNAEIGFCFKMPLQLLQAQMGTAALQQLYVFVFVRFIDNLHKVLLTSADPSNSFKQLQTASNSELSSAAVLSTIITGATWAWSGQTRPSSKQGEYLVIVTVAILNTLQYILIAEPRMFEGLH